MILDRAEIERLLPQRPPLLLVDRVLTATDGPEPRLVAALDLRGDEPILAGHFPGRPIWPGSYTIEGLAQTCALLGGWKALGTGRANVTEAPPALVAAVKVKLLRPVVPPATLTYRVAHTHQIGDLRRFAVEADVGGALVAQGTLDVVWREAG
jgi:3-hydroxyacyl-[acyl-carrier-protein] dehydratase